MVVRALGGVYQHAYIVSTLQQPPFGRLWGYKLSPLRKLAVGDLHKIFFAPSDLP